MANVHWVLHWLYQEISTIHNARTNMIQVDHIIESKTIMIPSFYHQYLPELYNKHGVTARFFV